MQSLSRASGIRGRKQNMANHPNRTAAAADRATIKAWALAKGERYRIRATGEVDIYGRMPNSIETGWWFAAWVDGLAADIRDGKC